MTSNNLNCLCLAESSLVSSFLFVSTSGTWKGNLLSDQQGQGDQQSQVHHCCLSCLPHHLDQEGREGQQHPISTKQRKRRNQMLCCRYYEALFIETTLTHCHTYRFTLVTTFSLGTSRAWFTLESNIKRDYRITYHSKNPFLPVQLSWIKNIFHHPMSHLPLFW